MRSFLTITLLGLTLSFQAQVGINTTSPSPASVLDVSSTNDNLNYGGFIPPRVNLIQRSLIPVTSNDDGMVIYLIDGTNRCIQLYDGVEAQWKNMYCMPINQAPVANSVNFTGDLHVGSMLIGSFVYSDAEGDFEGTHSYT
ncbi:MAG: hypothetical protein ACI86C_001387, partial [Candidatus Latescibacterota bacterium]